MTLEQRVLGLAQAIGADIKALKTADGNLAILSTANKTSLVAAINEIFTIAASAGIQINDAAPSSSTTVAYSPAKITALIASAVSNVLGGASAAYDTLLEIQNELIGDDTAIANLLSAVGNRVAFDVAQSLTTAQKLMACTNIGVGNSDRDFVADYVTAKT
jgi:hypothetical protein